jgi:hypothetical protein
VATLVFCVGQSPDERAAFRSFSLSLSLTSLWSISVFRHCGNLGVLCRTATRRACVCALRNFLSLSHFVHTSVHGGCIVDYLHSTRIIYQGLPRIIHVRTVCVCMCVIVARAAASTEATHANGGGHRTRTSMAGSGARAQACAPRQSTHPRANTEYKALQDYVPSVREPEHE